MCGYPLTKAKSECLFAFFILNTYNETYTLAMRYKQILFGLILFAILGVFLQITSKFHFFYIEQLQLFQFSGDYLADKISYPGGLSSVIGEFLTQFFITPYLGPFIFAASPRKKSCI